MGLTIAILLTLAMMGSVLWVMPSPREKKLTEFRRYAMSKGIRVRLIDAALAKALIPWIENHRGYVSYELGLPAGQSLGLKSMLTVRISDDSSLHELDRTQALRVAVMSEGRLDSLPDDCEALVFNPNGVAVVWRESGDLEGLYALVRVLEDCLKIDQSILQAA